MVEQNIMGWFEIAVDDVSRAKAFYETVLETTIEKLPKMGPAEMWAFPMKHDAPQAAGALVKSENFTPSKDGTLVYFTVSDLDAAVKRVEDAGGSVVLQKTSIGEHGSIVWILDTEGNRVALHACKSDKQSPSKE